MTSLSCTDCFVSTSHVCWVYKVAFGGGWCAWGGGRRGCNMDGGTLGSKLEPCRRIGKLGRVLTAGYEVIKGALMECSHDMGRS